MIKNDNINVLLGTMQFGERVFGQDSLDMLNMYESYGYSDIDTAYVYSNGESEKLIGEYLHKTSKSFRVATKVNPKVTGSLDENAIRMQLTESLKRLKRESVDLLYLHFPARDMPLEQTLEACHTLYEEGKICALGLSNFPSWLVEESFEICQKKSWLCPTVYEGLYNPLSRKAEESLNVVLSSCNMSFYAYNPLAGGLLTNKYTDRLVKEGRFADRPNYKERYWHDSYFNAIEKINKVCQKYDMSITEASFRWLANHSMLTSQRKDGIIIGASKRQQLIDNIMYIKKGELPIEVITVIEKAWGICKLDAPEYFSFA